MTITATQERQVIDQVAKQALIGGQWRDALGGETFEVVDPSTAEPLCEVADTTEDDARAALDAAVEAQRSWMHHPPRKRGEILRRAYEAMNARVDELALLMTLEMGKPLEQARSEVSYAAEFFRWFSEEAVRIGGRWSSSPDGAGRILTAKQPVGPCLLITPWNFPLAMGTRKVGPAIAAGCTMVMKPAQLTPLSMLALGQVLVEVGLPAGVFNLIPSSSASQVTAPLITDRRLRKLSFTGSTPVGSKLMEQAAANVLRVSMELGGNAPFLVFDDADIDAAVDGAIVAKMRNIGESCVAANRFHVAEPVADDFTGRLAERMGALKLGRGTEDDVDVGPLIDEDQRAKVAGLVDEAVERGAKTLVGGSKRNGAGFFYEPTVLAGMPHDAQMRQTEIFGPVAPVYTFSDEEEALRQANDTDYGLVAYVYTRDLDRAVRVMEGLEVGMVGINRGKISDPAAPFGGVKQSGIGREGGFEGIEEYLSTKYVALAGA